MTDEDLDAILEVSRRNNKELGITGMLLYSGGSFIQALEGRRSAVHGTCDHIFRDARHTDISVITEHEIATRSFPEWTMGFERVETGEVARRLGRSDFMDPAAEMPDCFRGRRSAAHTLLLSFRNSTSLHRGG